MGKGDTTFVKRKFKYNIGDKVRYKEIEDIEVQPTYCTHCGTWSEEDYDEKIHYYTGVITDRFVVQGVSTRCISSWFSDDEVEHDPDEDKMAFYTIKRRGHEDDVDEYDIIKKL